MSVVLLGFAGGMFLLLHDSVVFELSGKAYAITLGLAGIYALTGLLVWRGFRFGLVLNYLCSLLYLARPPLGLRIWKTMRSEEFRRHFRHGQR